MYRTKEDIDEHIKKEFRKINDELMEFKEIINNIETEDYAENLVEKINIDEKLEEIENSLKNMQGFLGE